jgi:hypothetical protein
MKKFAVLALILSILLTGCATLSKTLSEGTEDNYDFRKTRWGFSRERVLLAEQGNRIHLRKEDVLIYKSKIAGVPALLVYTFKDKRLRSAGYITEKPVKNAQNIIKKCVDEFGTPTNEFDDGMVWETPKTVIYANVYSSHVTVGISSREQTSSGVFSNTEHNPPKNKPGTIERWDGVWSYIDRTFYDELQDDALVLADISFYEKVLFGMIKRRKIINFLNETGMPTSIHAD